MSKVLLASGALLQTHDKQDCLLHSGVVEHCSIHAPSEHPLRNAPMAWHGEFGLWRICTHGIEHPDRDDLDFKSATLQFMTVEAICSTHLSHCDGCCQKVDLTPVKS